MLVEMAALGNLLLPEVLQKPCLLLSVDQESVKYADTEDTYDLCVQFHVVQGPAFNLELCCRE